LVGEYGRQERNPALAKPGESSEFVGPTRNSSREKAKLTLWLLMGAAAFVLVIACANVANLTLMRGVRREHELVVRAALGAGTGRVRRLLLAENLLLALLGGVLGLLLAIGGVRMVISFAARYSPRANEIRIDGAVLGFTLVLAVLVAVLLSFAPKLAQERTLGVALAAGGKRATGGVRRSAAAASVGGSAGGRLSDAPDRRWPSDPHHAAPFRGGQWDEHRGRPNDGDSS
jgi:putative ABC transport system permease protein